MSGPRFPCERWIEFERVFNPDPALREQIALTYADPSIPQIQDECALILSRRISEEANKRGISTGEVRRLWRQALREGRVLYGSAAELAPDRIPGALLLALAPRRSHG